MSTRTVPVLVLLLLLTAPAARLQTQPETGAVCVEGAGEPTALSFGVHTFHTDGCAIGPLTTDSDAFRFSGTGGDRVRLTVRSTGPVDPQVELRDPTGAVVATGGCSPGPCSAEIRVALAATGAFSATVVDAGADDAGEYRLELDREPPDYCPPLLEDATPHDDTLDPATDVDALKFQARVGETVRIEVVSTGGLDPRVVLVDPLGSELRDENCTGPCTLTVDQVLASAGTFHALVSEAGADETGTYSITFRCIGGTCLGHAFTDGMALGPDRSGLAWGPVSDATATYDLARGDLGGLRGGAGLAGSATSCVASGSMAPAGDDPEQPGPGQGFWYVARARGTDRLIGPWDTVWGPSQTCGRTTTVCDSGGEGTECATPIEVEATPYSDSRSTCGAPAAVGDYNNFDTTNLCNTLFYAGPELIYHVVLGSANALMATLTPEATADLAMFLVSDCATPTSCVAWADSIGPGMVSQLNAGTLPAGDYYLYIDAFDGAGPSSCGNYTLEVGGDLGAAPTLLGFDVE